jgi:hypothetical protein
VCIEKLLQQSSDYRVQTIDAVQKLADVKREWRLDAGGLLRVVKNAVSVIEMVGLPPRADRRRGCCQPLQFFADMVGKLEVLNLKVIERLQHEGMEIAGQLAGAILPRVHFLAPDFPFN